MINATDTSGEAWTGDQVLAALGALANPHRLRIVAALAGGRTYVSRLARELGIGRPLLHMHLAKLEAAGLVRSQLELGDEGKAMRFFEVVPFALALTPERIARAAQSLSTDAAVDRPARIAEEGT